MSKKYALIEGYGKMIVPVSMLEKITETATWAVLLGLTARKC